jgi:hypothetical protein
LTTKKNIAVSTPRPLRGLHRLLRPSLDQYNANKTITEGGGYYNEGMLRD